MAQADVTQQAPRFRKTFVVVDGRSSFQADPSSSGATSSAFKAGHNSFYLLGCRAELAQGSAVDLS